jgi:hypothetical protein
MGPALLVLSCRLALFCDDRGLHLEVLISFTCHVSMALKVSQRNGLFGKCCYEGARQPFLGDMLSLELWRWALYLLLPNCANESSSDHGDPVTPTEHTQSPVSPPFSPGCHQLVDVPHCLFVECYCQLLIDRRHCCIFSFSLGSSICQALCQGL